MRARWFFYASLAVQSQLLSASCWLSLRSTKPRSSQFTHFEPLDIDSVQRSGWSDDWINSVVRSGSEASLNVARVERTLLELTFVATLEQDTYPSIFEKRVAVARDLLLAIRARGGWTTRFEAPSLKNWELAEGKMSDGSYVFVFDDGKFLWIKRDGHLFRGNLRIPDEQVTEGRIIGGGAVDITDANTPEWN